MSIEKYSPQKSQIVFTTETAPVSLFERFGQLTPKQEVEYFQELEEDKTTGIDSLERLIIALRGEQRGLEEAEVNEKYYRNRYNKLLQEDAPDSLDTEDAKYNLEQCEDYIRSGSWSNTLHTYQAFISNCAGSTIAKQEALGDELNSMLLPDDMHDEEKVTNAIELARSENDPTEKSRQLLHIVKVGRVEFIDEALQSIEGVTGQLDKAELYVEAARCGYVSALKKLPDLIQQVQTTQQAEKSNKDKLYFENQRRLTRIQYEATNVVFDSEELGLWSETFTGGSKKDDLGSDSSPQKRYLIGRMATKEAAHK